MLLDGTRLPTSAVAVTMATGVILTSLVLASLGLPLLLSRLNGLADEIGEDHRAARRSVAEHALPVVERLCEAEKERQAMSLLAEYRARAGRETLDGMGVVEPIALRLACITAERQTVYALLKARQLNEEAADRLLQELDAAELHHGGRSNR